MYRQEFRIGVEFYCVGRRWRCTDVGSRVVVAVCLEEPVEDPSWFDGPPYGATEYVLDEQDLELCVIARGWHNESHSSGLAREL